MIMICNQSIKKVLILLIYLGFLLSGGSHFVYGNMMNPIPATATISGLPHFVPPSPPQPPPLPPPLPHGMTTIPEGSHLIYGNMEFSTHFAKKFQTNGAWNFGVDTFYRLFLNENSRFATGIRYRYFFKSISTSMKIIDVPASGKRNKHRLAFLKNYRFYIDRFFIGAIIGIDIWKSLNITAQGSEDGVNAEVSTTSMELLWNKLTGQLALELGYMITPKILVNLEIGYDLFGFNQSNTIERSDSSSRSERSNVEIGDNHKYNGFYASVGLGYSLSNLF